MSFVTTLSRDNTAYNGIFLMSIFLTKTTINQTVDGTIKTMCVKTLVCASVIMVGCCLGSPWGRFTQFDHGEVFSAHTGTHPTYDNVSSVLGFFSSTNRT